MAGESILVVDDEKDARETICEFLKEHACPVVVRPTKTDGRLYGEFSHPRMRDGFFVIGNVKGGLKW